MNRTRTYRMDSRAAGAELTRERVAAAAERAFSSQWYDDVTVRGIAADAGVSLQTVLNHFPTKDALCAVANERFAAAIESARWSVAPGDVRRAVEVLVDDYERTGDTTLRALAVEHRVPAVQPWLQLGRAGHQRWIEEVFAPFIEGLDAQVHARRVAQLVIATDVYAWRLLRRDRGLPPDQVREVLTELVRALLAKPRHEADDEDTTNRTDREATR